MVKSLKRIIQLPNVRLYQVSGEPKTKSNLMIIIVFVLVCVYFYYNWDFVLEFISNIFK